MIDKICFYTFQGRFFSEKQTWGIFEKNQNQSKTIETSRISLIYGRNGSGKSTFCEAVSAYGSGSTDFSSLSFLDVSGKNLPISKESVHVFNEEFIDSEVRSKNDSINAIIMLGEAGKTEMEIAAQDKIKKDAEAAIGSIDIDKYSRAKSPVNIENLEKACRDSLNTSSWAKEEAELEGKAIFRITTRTIDDLQEIKLSSLDTAASLQKQYHEAFNQYKQVKGANLPLPLLPVQFEYKVAFVQALDLLKTTLSRPLPSALEAKLLNELNKGQFSEDLDARRNLFAAKETSECPYCFQPISSERKESIVVAINQVLNQEAKDFMVKLVALTFPDNSNEILQLNSYIGIIEPTIVESFRSIASLLKQRILDIKVLISKKRDNPFGEVDLKPFERIEQECLTYKSSYQDLSTAIQTYNRAILEKERLLQIAIEAHKKLGKVESGPTFKTLDATRRQQQKDLDAVASENAKIKMADTALSALNAKRQHADIAIGEINSVLSDVFMSSSRLFLQATPENPNLYFVYSRGHKIKCKDLSTGERNLIGLVYFVLKTQTNQTKQSEFSNESLFVLDDPVSSFDNENKTQVYRYIFNFCLRVLKGNPMSKILLLSHQYETIQSIKRLFDNFRSVAKPLPNKTDFDPLSKHIKADCSLETINDRAFNDYQYLMKSIVNFGF